jgi:hypothetical protein
LKITSARYKWRYKEGDMRKNLIVISMVLALALAPACGGSGGGGGGGGGGDIGEHALQAKAVSVTAAFAAIMSFEMAFQAAFISMQDYGPDIPASGTHSFTDTTYETLLGGEASDDATVSGDFNFTYSGDYTTPEGATFTIPAGSLEHETSVTLVNVPSFEIGTTSFEGVSYATAAGNPIAGDSHGATTFTWSGAEEPPTYKSVSMNEDGMGVQNLSVTLPDDATESSIDFSGWEFSATLSSNKLPCTIENASATVTYGSETYSCTKIGVTFTAPMEQGSSEEATLTVGDDITCRCTNCT